ncbi:bifunctional 5,10-methylenetetrahydrofolate dehydrogenase/5,10-methenyltetrahydrofolate cyclohydrolase [Metamycoplasma auris]|uniref:Bifunctional protein FolD n=1 Tax=Metamycoplasma auris TaxID=51363 RepID=A0A2W7I1U2_9BACT|nr:bifunctional 5,10-methylenetetrahydrofolate dehydrogenase/5,10-methenyltetrahydrofolate cyclohydrolase [Metamycoplasma auris]PZW01406.1 methylenetetrahydrofolate dehydrogenase (NADP+)/methenyltetrahydrofolate cyclohydrolase [Metamycoplasma auris]
MAILLDGRKLKEKLQSKIEVILKDIPDNQLPILGILQVGNFEESNIYIRHKLNVATKLGIKTCYIKLQEDATESEILSSIKVLNDKTTGFIMQLPIQTKNVANVDYLLDQINKIKDIDGLNHHNQEANYILENDSFLPATATGIICLLDEYNIDYKNKTIGVVGQSKIIGKPISNFFEQLGIKVRRYDINTKKDDMHLNDILIVATGNRGCISNIKLKEDVIIIDVGIHRLENGKISGDVIIADIKENISYLTPVPGGVGPMTIIGLILNLLKSYDIQSKTNIYKRIFES